MEIGVYRGDRLTGRVIQCGASGQRGWVKALLVNFADDRADFRRVEGS